MTEAIRGYITRDGREIPCIGTLVQESDVLHFSHPPEGLVFYLGGHDKIMVHFVRYERRLPIDHPLVKSYLWTVLREGRRRSPTKAELEIYLHRCITSALAHTPTGAEAEEAMLWREPVVLAAEILLYQWFYENSAAGREELRYVCRLTTLRKNLKEICEAPDRKWDTSDWDEGNHFRGYLEDREPLLKKVNVKLTFERTGAMRKVVLEYIDRAQIPPWRPPVTR